VSPRESNAVARRSPLELGYWSFFGAWSLGFGAFFPTPAARPAPVSRAHAHADAARSLPRPGRY
jgi:hypothetical protein